MQQELADGTTWVLDGDLGPYDSLQHRLASAHTGSSSTSVSFAAPGGPGAGHESERTSGGDRAAWPGRPLEIVAIHAMPAPKFRRLLPDAREILADLTKRNVKLSLGGSHR